MCSHTDLYYCSLCLRKLMGCSIIFMVIITVFIITIILYKGKLSQRRLNLSTVLCKRHLDTKRCCSVAAYDSLWHHGLQYTRLLCSSLSSGVCSNSWPLRDDIMLTKHLIFCYPLLLLPSTLNILVHFKKVFVCYANSNNEK